VAEKSWIREAEKKRSEKREKQVDDYKVFA
jgi:hypothetical protein